MGVPLAFMPAVELASYPDKRNRTPPENPRFNFRF
jgi:hypothetical protein